MQVKICDICKKPIEPKSLFSRFIFHRGITIKARTLDYNEKIDICPNCIQKIIDEVRGGKQ